MLHLPADVPVVAAEAGREDAVPLVAVDQIAGARAATQHLLDLGHRTVWHVSGPRDWLEAQDRVDGWRSTLEAGRRRAAAVLVGDWSAQSGYELGQRAGRRRPTSARCSSPTTRWRSASCARCTRRAAGIPSEISIVGFDDIPEAAYFTPPLTTVRQDFNEMGRLSLHVLLEQIEGGIVSSARTTVAPELVVRASTAPARG